MNELVYLKNDEAVCDSLQVAEKFGKRVHNLANYLMVKRIKDNAKVAEA